MKQAFLRRVGCFRIKISMKNKAKFFEENIENTD